MPGRKAFWSGAGRNRPDFPPFFPARRFPRNIFPPAVSSVIFSRRSDLSLYISHLHWSLEHLLQCSISSPFFLPAMSLPCSDQDFRPKKMKDASLPPGVDHLRCWCGNLCKVKEVTDFSDKFGMKFFMCPNYEYDPPERTSLFARPAVCFDHDE